jgi:polysaccharide export outer membrane protein
MNMRKRNLLFAFVAAALLASCGTSNMAVRDISIFKTPKDIVYFQDVYEYAGHDIAPYEVYIHPDDLLAIMVNSQVTEAALPFNLPITSYYVGGDVYSGQQRLLGYLVDKEGNIDFPVIGKIHVEGLTRNQLREHIKETLIKEGYLNDPIVTVNFLNFKVSVQGEVNRPGTFYISSERITLLEALSMAGDLTIYGRRDRVVVIREVEGRRYLTRHDLTTADLFASPFYYLQQNDMVYVEPNKRRIQQSNINQNNNVGVWLSAVSVFFTILTLLTR